MKAIMKTVTRGQGGNVLVMVLILLVVGSLILAPLLGLMGTGVMAGEIYENKTAELYAADAGVEDAIWQIQNDVPDSYPYVYPEPLVINDKSVNITVLREDLDPTCGEKLEYEIISIVTGEDGASTTVNAHLSVSYLDLSALLDYAVVSNDSIDIKPNVAVNGSVWLPYEEDLSLAPGSEISGDIVTLSDGVSQSWPGFEELSAYYWEDVKHLSPYPHDNIDIAALDPKAIGPLYRDGSLTIDNTGDADTLILEGTVYIGGNLAFNQAGSHNYTINLNGHTIFAEGYITFPSKAVSVSGSGCIIARDYVIFQPSVSSNPDDFVLVMSIEGTATIQPNGDFTGCIWGQEVVQLQPAQGEDFTVTWISPEGKVLDIPMGVGDLDELPPVAGSSVTSWEIS